MPRIHRRAFALGAPLALAALTGRKLCASASDVPSRLDAASATPGPSAGHEDGAGGGAGTNALRPPAGRRTGASSPARQGQAPMQAASTVRVRRSFADSAEGQLHLRLVLQSGGTGAVPLVCLHDTPYAGRMFRPWLTAFGESRDVLAPDLPGYGDSDPPSSPPSIGDYAWAVGRLIDGLGIPRVDLAGVGVGALVAIDLAVERAPFVRRLVLVSIPLLGDAEQRATREALGPPVFDATGSHWRRAWQGLWAARAPEQPVEELASSFADLAASGARDWWGERAAFDYATAARLSRVAQPTLVLRSAGRWVGTAERAQSLLPAASLASPGDSAGPGLRASTDFAMNPAAFIAPARAFLDRV